MFSLFSFLFKIFSFANSMCTRSLLLIILLRLFVSRYLLFSFCSVQIMFIYKIDNKICTNVNKRNHTVPIEEGKERINNPCVRDNYFTNKSINDPN